MTCIELLGWSPADLVGRELTTIIPERFLLPHRLAFDALRRSRAAAT